MTMYKVRYKPNPAYKGDYKGPSVPGLQGSFGLIQDAEAAVKSCKRYFNTERILDDVPHPDGSVTQEKQTIIHDNVIVWIDTVEDGVTVPEDAKELVTI